MDETDRSRWRYFTVHDPLDEPGADSYQYFRKEVDGDEVSCQMLHVDLLWHDSEYLSRRLWLGSDSDDVFTEVDPAQMRALLADAVAIGRFPALPDDLA